MILKYADWLSGAEQEIRQLNTGQQFLLSDLFQGYRWKQLSKADRSFLGNLFLRAVYLEKSKEFDGDAGARRETCMRLLKNK